MCAARDWVAGLAPSGGTPGSPERRRQIQDEAVRRDHECHTLCDTARTDIDSGEVGSAMACLDQEVATVLGQVAKGDFAPDLTALQRRLDELAAAAKHRLTIRLGPRSRSGPAGRVPP
ncbi:hypothetical protein [Streptomyces sp. NPDC006739]|uniref:hypothetical protein n=1 Tax=Streptomyces sp. NPDC006739 TaxID=3364763 RepID=UPI0036AB9CAA